MSLSRVSLSRAGGGRPARLRGAGALWRPAALLSSLLLGACSTAGPVTQSAGWSPSLVAAPMAVPPLQAHPQVEIEGDGLEGQRPPRRRAEQVPDDPAEPFSPNYGSLPLPESGPAPEPA